MTKTVHQMYKLSFHWVLYLLAIFALSNVHAENEPVPLFREDHTLSLELRVPFKELFGNQGRKSREFRWLEFCMSRYLFGLV